MKVLFVSDSKLVREAWPPGGRLTRDNITGIHGILVFDKSKAVHELDFGDLAGTMGGEVSLNVGLGSFRRGGGSA